MPKENDIPYFFNNLIKAYQTLVSEIIPSIADQFEADVNFDIWNPTAKTGQESFSLLIGADSKLRKDILKKLYLLSTSDKQEDIDKIKEGIFSGMEVQRGLPIKLLLKYFEQLPDKSWKVSSKLGTKIDQKVFNFETDPPIEKKFHLIACPGLFEYDMGDSEKILSQLEASLKKGGAVFTIKETPQFESSDKWSKTEVAGIFYYTLN
ncbi:MAG: CheR family methyltransferase [Bacteriovoracaceae bacterium]